MVLVSQLMTDCTIYQASSPSKKRCVYAMKKFVEQQAEKPSPQHRRYRRRTFRLPPGASSDPPRPYPLPDHRDGPPRKAVQFTPLTPPVSTYPAIAIAAARIVYTAAPAAENFRFLVSSSTGRPTSPKRHRREISGQQYHARCAPLLRQQGTWQHADQKRHQNGPAHQCKGLDYISHKHPFGTRGRIPNVGVPLPSSFIDIDGIRRCLIRPLAPQAQVLLLCISEPDAGEDVAAAHVLSAVSSMAI